MNWYALHLRSNTESQVVSRLALDRVESFYPHVLSKSKDRRRSVERKFFPGYLFSRFQLGRYEQRLIIELPQVISILGWTPNRPAPIPDSEIAAIRQMISMAPNPELLAAGLLVSQGDQVRVMRGPFRGLEGVIAGPANKKRFAVSITMMGRSLSVAMDPGMLIPLAKAKAA